VKNKSLYSQQCSFETIPIASCFRVSSYVGIRQKINENEYQIILSPYTQDIGDIYHYTQIDGLILRVCEPSGVFVQ